MDNWLSWDALMGQDGDAAGEAAAPAAEGANTDAGAKSEEGSGKESEGLVTAKSDDPDNPEQQQQQGSFADILPFMFLLIGFMVIMTFVSGRGRKKQQRQHQEMYTGLKRDDKIMLVTGKYVVVDKVEDERITVFADVNRNVREVYHKNAVAKREGDAESSASPDASAPSVDKDAG